MLKIVRRAAAMAVVVFAFAAASAGAEEIVGARTPELSPDGSRIAFCWMGDIWIAPSGGGNAMRLTVHEATESSPHWSPDGKQIAFSSDRHGNDDVFVVDAAGGRPERLTWHASGDGATGWASDGEVYFTSGRGARTAMLYRTNRSGAHPVVVVQDRVLEAALSPDGNWLCFVDGYTPWWRKHYRGSASRDLWLRHVNGGDPVRITEWNGDDDDPMWAPDGKSIYFVSEREDQCANIWKVGVDVSGGSPRAVGRPTRVTAHDRFSIESASISGDGRLIAYERHGKVMTVPTVGGNPKEIALHAVSDDKWNRIQRRSDRSGATEFALSPDEDEMAIVVRGEVFVLGLDDGKSNDRIRRVTNSPARDRDIAWAPDGNTLFFASDRHGSYDLFSVTSADEEEDRLSRSLRTEVTRLTESDVADRGPVPSPDGETVAFKRGNGYLWTMNSDGSGEKQLHRSSNTAYIRWSPDSKWIAISQSNLGSLEDVYLLSADGDVEYNVSRGYQDDYSPYFVDDGKKLVFATRDDRGHLWLKYTWLTKAEELRTQRERDQEEQDEKPEEGKKDDDDDDDDGDADDSEDIPETKIDFDGLFERVHQITKISGGYNPFAASPDGKFLAVLSDQARGNDLWLVSERGDDITRLTTGESPRVFTFRKDGRGIYYLGRGGNINLIEIDDDGKVKGGPKGISFEANYEIDLAAEAKQKFHEAWGMLRDGFYDPDFHGYDWEALRDAYEPRALAAYTVHEFSTILQELIGELSASHLGVYPPGNSGDNTAAPGILIDETYHGPGVRVARVLKNTPADRPDSKIEEGEYIISVNGKPVESNGSYFGLWNHLGGERVEIEVAMSPSGKSSRTVVLIPSSGGHMYGYLSETWIDDNRARTEELSDGKVGYLHMQAMGAGDIARFENELIAHAGDKKALILDIRNNNGGFVHDQVLTILQRRAYARNMNRGREDTMNPYEIWDRPVVCLINERSYSDGEIFPHAFKTLRLGRVVGEATYGAVIGTQNFPLIDGTVFRIPGSGWFSLDGVNLENNGVQPDVRVEEFPEDRAKNRDRQLERAVEILLEQVK